MIHFHFITLFPEVCQPYLNSSIIGRARDSGRIKISFYNPKDLNPDPSSRVDHRPYGGGPGMVLKAEPVIKAIEKAKGRKKQTQVIYFSPAGEPYTNQTAKKLSQDHRHLILVAGRYEGVDARVRAVFPGPEYSVGSFVLTGGELPALAVADSVSRQITGVLGDERSLEETRTASREVYTRPAVLKYKGRNYPVPDVLQSGHHQQIENWREEH